MYMRYEKNIYNYKQRRAGFDYMSLVLISLQDTISV